MKTTFVVLVLALFSFANSKRHKPRYDEIERIVNDTHSVYWKCSIVECPFGQGLNVQCGTSIPFNVSIECLPCVLGVSYSDRNDYSSCKTCKRCSNHEKRSGQCSLEEDTTICLRTCDKGYYWEDLTDSCPPCSYCCRKIVTNHEKQCEGSGLPFTHQCRKTGIRCPRPVNSSDDQKPSHQDELSSDNPQQQTLTPSSDDQKPPHQDELSSDHPQQQTLTPSSDDQKPPHQHELSSDHPQQQTLTPLEIGAIIFTSVLVITTFAVIIVVAMFGWQETKTMLKRSFCKCCGSKNSTNEETINFNGYVSRENTWPLSSTESETHLEEARDKIGSLNSAPPVNKRPVFMRVFSLPNENQSKVKPAPIPRSKSHPGCLHDLNKETTGNKPNSPKNCVRNQRTKKVGKKLYVSVATTDEGQTDLSDHDKTDAEGAEHHYQLCPPSPAAKTQYTSTTGLHHITRDSLESVPQGFQAALLSKKLSTIPLEFRCKICAKLNILHECFGDDYRLLGEKIGLENDAVSWLGQNGNPTQSIMQKFDSKKDSSVGKFRRILEEMERHDVISVIEEWIVSEWRDACRSSLAVLV